VEGGRRGRGGHRADVVLVAFDSLHLGGVGHRRAVVHSAPVLNLEDTTEPRKGTRRRVLTAEGKETERGRFVIKEGGKNEVELRWRIKSRNTGSFKAAVKRSERSSTFDGKVTRKCVRRGHEELGRERHLFF